MQLGQRGEEARLEPDPWAVGLRLCGVFLVWGALGCGVSRAVGCGTCGPLPFFCLWAAARSPLS